MNFSEQPPSKHWAALKFRGEEFAGVWFKPETDPFALTFRIPQKSFQIPGIGQLLTTENLLKSVGLTSQEIESWRVGETSHAGMDGANSELAQLLLPPAPEVEHLDIRITLKGAPQPAASTETAGPEISLSKWQDLEARWKAILGLESTMESLRQRMDTLRADMEASWNKALTPEEKGNALNTDVAQWAKAKARVHHAVPKAKEYIHRVTWLLGVPERKKLEEIYKNHIHPHISFPEIDKVPEQLDNLLKDRQVLSAHGVTVYQECQGISGEIKAALRTLQINAANRKRMGAAKAKGKSH